MTESKMLQFLQDFEDGKVSKYLKSAAPVDDEKLNVKMIVGQDFEKRVLESDKHVLLKIYAPWCKHCTDAEPVYQRLADILAKNDSLMIAKFEVTANEHPSVIVKGMPAFLFYKKGDKFNPINFGGNRTLKGFGDFLKQYMGNDWKDGDMVLDESL